MKEGTWNMISDVEWTTGGNDDREAEGMLLIEDRTQSDQIRNFLLVNREYIFVGPLQVEPRDQRSPR
jgi:hypothetical protein